VFSAHVTDADSLLAKKGNVFQRLKEASELYQKHLGFALDRLDPAG
jgi:hypothetical protein